MPLKCYSCGDGDGTIPCDKFNTTSQAFWQNCDDQLFSSCVGSYGAFHDVSGQFRSKLLISKIFEKFFIKNLF